MNAPLRVMLCDDSATVRAFFIHNALYWLEEYRFDGLRFLNA